MPKKVLEPKQPGTVILWFTKKLVFLSEAVKVPDLSVVSSNPNTPQVGSESTGSSRFQTQGGYNSFVPNYAIDVTLVTTASVSKGT